MLENRIFEGNIQKRQGTRMTSGRYTVKEEENRPPNIKMQLFLRNNTFFCPKTCTGKIKALILRKI
ncbi:hypothetical protein HMPREF9012_2168 [Bacteroidetes bacterium oral taxon 272 str. F0290]|nr:hypothetical protein HMPREF9012_2168 [Bacteroidetes bacterium oral taxon 272 str. F0290]